jgi:hypothetical protein
LAGQDEGQGEAVKMRLERIGEYDELVLTTKREFRNRDYSQVAGQLQAPEL